MLSDNLLFTVTYLPYPIALGTRKGKINFLIVGLGNGLDLKASETKGFSLYNLLTL
jgi:hypothetical protein